MIASRKLFWVALLTILLLILGPYTLEIVRWRIHYREISSIARELSSSDLQLMYEDCDQLYVDAHQANFPDSFPAVLPDSWSIFGFTNWSISKDRVFLFGLRGQGLSPVGGMDITCIPKASTNDSDRLGIWFANKRLYSPK